MSEFDYQPEFVKSRMLLGTSSLFTLCESAHSTRRLVFTSILPFSAQARVQLNVLMPVPLLTGQGPKVNSFPVQSLPEKREIVAVELKIYNLHQHCLDSKHGHC
jgi:hypothetical protein